MFRHIFIVVFSICAWSCHQPDVLNLNANEMPDAVVAKLMAQQNAWNEGDINAFMEIAYWRDDALLFIGSKGPTYGFDATLANYERSYPDAAAMGTLRFELLDWKTLGADHGLMIGSWALSRKGELEDLQGHFSLTWECQEGNWVIIADHSS
ncbi:MAG: nuclear transport factor 2 family protein [Bacteroidetes bacterium]|jgi:ketosteroid isomerase-like protein|nr:nuclear transport factor 2 family protein [Bacteroidota bacterium]